MRRHFVPVSGLRGMAVMDFFRLGNGKVVERGDALQEVHEEMARRDATC